MASEETIEFKHGVVVLQSADTVAVQDAPELPGSSGMSRILDMIDEPDAPVADISRLIAREIANIVKQMGQTETDPLHRRVMRDMNDHVKALRELQKTLTEGDVLSRKDALNLDGPKFRFVFQSIVDFFVKALKEAGADDSLAQRVMLQFSDMIKTNDETLRRDMNKIESGR